jgi:hypothetical protein
VVGGGGGEHAAFNNQGSRSPRRAWNVLTLKINAESLFETSVTLPLGTATYPEDCFRVFVMCFLYVCRGL